MREADAGIVDLLGQHTRGNDRRPIEFNPVTWRPRLLQHPVAQEVLDELKGGSTIDRDYLRTLALGLTAGDENAHLRLFTAVMIWGTGTADGRGAWRTEQALDSHPGRVLAKTAALVAQGKLDEAYRTFRTCRVPRVGPAFFTKWLWAVGTRNSEPPWPLILDSRVSKSLKHLG